MIISTKLQLCKMQKKCPMVIRGVLGSIMYNRVEIVSFFNLINFYYRLAIVRKNIAVRWSSTEQSCRLSCDNEIS